MKIIINFFTKHRVAKVISLITAVVIWLLIREQVGDFQPRLYQDTLHNDSWTD